MLRSNDVEELICQQRHQPWPPIALVSNNGNLVAGSVTLSLSDGIVDIERLDAFDLEVNPVEFWTFNIWRVWPASPLLASFGIVTE